MARRASNRLRGFPLSNSILSGQALAQRVLSKFHLADPVSCYFLNPGLNDTYVVAAGPSIFILRVYRHGWRTKAEIQAELDMLVYLHRRRMPVSWPLKRKDGSLLTRIAAPEGVRYAALFTYAPGTPIDLNANNCSSYGELLGRFHTCLDKRADDPRRFHLDLAYLVDEPLRYLEPHLEHRRKDFDYLASVGRALKSELEGLLPTTKPEYGCCHGDHYGGNVHMDERDRMTVYDFDCYGYGWRAYDLAVFLAKNAQLDGTSSSGRAKSTRRWDSFLGGYSSVRAPSKRELEAIQTFVPVRLIWRLGMQAQIEDWGRDWAIGNTVDEDIKFMRYWLDHRLNRTALT